MSRVSVGILALTQLRLERRFGRALGSWRIRGGAGRRAAKRLATRQGASIADRLVKKRPEMWPGRPVLTPCQVVLSHERGPGLHITQRVVPHVQHPPARYHSALDVHGERVEPAGGAIDQIEVRRAIIRKTSGPGDLNDQPTTSVQLLRCQYFIDPAVRLAPLLSLLENHSEQGQPHRNRSDHNAEKILGPSHALKVLLRWATISQLDGLGSCPLSESVLILVLLMSLLSACFPCCLSKSRGTVGNRSWVMDLAFAPRPGLPQAPSQGVTPAGAGSTPGSSSCNRIRTSGAVEVRTGS
jgi:hypothetical protein